MYAHYPDTSTSKKVKNRKLTKLKNRKRKNRENEAFEKLLPERRPKRKKKSLVVPFGENLGNVLNDNRSDKVQKEELDTIVQMLHFQAKDWISFIEEEGGINNFSIETFVDTFLDDDEFHFMESNIWYRKRSGLFHDYPQTALQGKYYTENKLK
jgi:hypothetical protein